MNKVILAGLCSAVFLPACAAVSAPGAPHGCALHVDCARTLHIDSAFPGGNVKILGVSERDGVVNVAPDLRDTKDKWFYWNFVVRGAAGRKLRFQFPRDGYPYLASLGPAISKDGGATWSWLHPDGKRHEPAHAFTYTFGPDEDKTHFAVAIPYVQRNWDAFVAPLRRKAKVEAGVLCKSQSGERDTELLRIRGGRKAKWLFLLTARHHACESSANFPMEGAITEALSNTPEGKWLRENAECVFVPFVDKDGVERGDQGKNRTPHDHNRDYLIGRYSSVRAIKDLVTRESAGRRFVFMDLHSPWVRSLPSCPEQDHVFTFGCQDKTLDARWRDFRKNWAEAQKGGALVYNGKHDIFAGEKYAAKLEKDWAAGFMSSDAWMRKQPNCYLASCCEFGYSLCGGVFSPDAGRELGRSLMKAIVRTVCRDLPPPASKFADATGGPTKGKVVHAKDYGWNPTNATVALQKAVDSGADIVVVDAMKGPWYIGKVKWRSDLTVRLVKGVRIHADLAQWEANKKHALFELGKGLKNFTLEGAGIDECLVGSFPTFEARAKYCRAGQELQHGVRISSGATNIVVRNVRLANCGCDGLTVCGWRQSSYNVLVEDVDMLDNHRQGCSLTVADRCTLRRCKFRNTRGTPPTAGVDVEPCYDVHPMRDVLFEDCEFANNDGGGLITPHSSIFPSDLTFKRCRFLPQRGSCPIALHVRGDTYRGQKTPADLRFVFEDCAVETYENSPGIEFTTASIATCLFKNMTIREVPGQAIWRGSRKCAPIEFVLDRDYHGAFPPSKEGKVSFENVTVTGFKERPLIQFVDMLGKQSVECFRGTIVYNGKAIDTSTFNYKAPDIDEPPHRRVPVEQFAASGPSRADLAAIPASNCLVGPWSAWYQPSPCYACYFYATKGDKVGFSVIYPNDASFKKNLKGVHLGLCDVAGTTDLGELTAGSNRFDFVVRETGWHSFFPPKQSGLMLIGGETGTRLAYQGDLEGQGEMRFRLRNEKKDYVGYFEVPPGVDCRLRVSGGTVELRDASGKVVDTADARVYPGRKVFTFRAKGNKPEVWSFRTPPGGRTRILRFYAPLNGIWADAPELLPRGGFVDAAPAPDVPLKKLGRVGVDLSEKSPLDKEFVYRAGATIDNVKPSARCDPSKTRTYTMKVKVYKRRGKSVRFFWFDNGSPDEKGGFDFVELYLPEKIDKPMWVDTVSGVACEIPTKAATWTGSTYILRGVPIRDRKVVVCDRSALPLDGEAEASWEEKPPADIVLYDGAPLSWSDGSLTIPGSWDLTQNRTIRIELENTSADGGVRIGVLDQGTGRSSAWVPAGFKGSVDIDLLPPLEEPGLRAKIKGMQTDPFYRATFSWTPEPQLINVRDLKLDHYALRSASSDAPGGKIPTLIVKKVTALETSKKKWPAWCAMGEKEFFPFIDKYGQFLHKTWPNKTTDDAQLKQAAKKEAKDLAANPGPDDRDKYGGWKKGPTYKATGRFRLEKINGKWWFVDPEGRLWWSHGVVRVTPSSAVTPLDGRKRYFAWLPKEDDTFAAFYHTYDELLKPYYDKRNIKETFDFSAANLCRKYGSGWRKAYADLSHRRLRSWGFNTIANSSDREIRRMFRTPFVERIETRGPRCKEQKNAGLWWHVPDPYSTEFRANLRRQLEANREELTSPWCLGLFVDNEHNWSGISEKTMREYFKVIREEIKRLDPELLYFGCRFAGANPTVVKVCADYADALSYNVYASRLDSFRLPDGIDKPILVGEFHFGCISDTGLFKPSLVWTPDQKHRAEAYVKYVGDALDHPNFVGTHWHQFSDQATSGRFDGENANVGFTDVCDTPYAELVEAARLVGRTMYARRWKASAK